MHPPRHHTYGTIHDDAGKKDVMYKAWTDADWDAYKKEFRTEVEKYLNWPKMQLYLMPQIRGTSKMFKIQFMYFQHRSPKQNKSTPYLRFGISIELVKDKDKDKAHVAFRVMREKSGDRTFNPSTRRSKEVRTTEHSRIATLTNGPPLRLTPIPFTAPSKMQRPMKSGTCWASTTSTPTIRNVARAMATT